MKGNKSRQNSFSVSKQKTNLVVKCTNYCFYINHSMDTHAPCSILVHISLPIISPPSGGVSIGHSLPAVASCIRDHSYSCTVLSYICKLCRFYFWPAYSDHSTLWNPFCEVLLEFHEGANGSTLSLDQCQLSIACDPCYNC